MKKISIIFAFFILSLQMTAQNEHQIPGKETLEKNPSVFVDKTDRNNNFYDNEETYSLPMPRLIIEGEIENPGPVDFSKFIKRTVIVKETRLNKDGSNSFIGAYRYDGYSLYDILNDRILKKKNAEEFRPIIDLYVEIENDKGEKVILSWGEIYYPNFLHNCILATDVMRIVPSKTRDLWPLPADNKLVIASDLLTERNISHPIKITVKSYDKTFPVNREISPLYSKEIKLFSGNHLSETYTYIPNSFPLVTLHTIFYGKGRGIHTTQPFTGIPLKEFLVKTILFTTANLKNGLIAIVGLDGYRSVYTVSEIMNRNDQAEVLLVPCPDEKDGGMFRIFPSCDFFSDRAVKAVSEIHFN